MKAKIALIVLALGASTCLVSAQDAAPPSGTQPPSQKNEGPGSPGGAANKRAGAGGRGGFHLLPPRAQEQLQLSDDQKKQIAALEAETKAKLEKILTPEQMQKLQTMRPPMRPGGPQMHGGPGGPGGDDSNLPPGPPPGDGGDSNGGPPGAPPGDN